MEDERVLIVEKINNTLKVIWGVFINFFLNLIRSKLSLHSGVNKSFNIKF